MEDQIILVDERDQNVGTAEKMAIHEKGLLHRKLEEIFSFRYKITLPNGLIENEYDHVLTGKSDALPKPDPKEVDEWKWINIKALKSDMKKNPEIFTYWFKILIRKLHK